MRYLVLIVLLLGCRSMEPRWHARIACDARPELDAEDYTSFALADLDVAYSMEPPFSKEAAFEILLNTRVFARSCDGGPPLKGAFKPSPQSAAFAELCREEGARDIFLDLIERAHVAGQLYGLCGLYLVDREEFIRRLPTYVSLHTRIYFANGCIHSFVAVADIVRADGHEDISGGEIPAELERVGDGFGVF
ncbi:MAG: hypothetical protein AB7O52_19160 [Planctomycetota bacterium]